MTPTVVLRDEDVVRRIGPADAVRVVRQALLDAARSPAIAPPRVEVRLPGGGLVLSAGTSPAQRCTGLRVYGAAGETGQVTACWQEDGRLAVVVLGTVLAEMRTGAVGAVAVDALARADAAVLGVLGSGPQAYRQVWAVTAVRPLVRVQVYSPRPYRRDAFARRVRDELAVPCRALRSARAAVRGADVVVAATCGTDVLDPDWLADGTHLTTLGPKRAGGSEVPRRVLERRPLTVTDSPAQVRAYPGGYFLPAEHMLDLGGLLGDGNAWRSDRLTLFGSVGITGSEVALAAAAARPDGARSR